MSTKDVDKYVKDKVRPEQQEVVNYFRNLVHECVPEVEELISYGIPMFKRNKMLAVISPTKKDVTFSFSKGASFDDKYHELGGVGSVSKYVKIADLGSVNEEALRYYIAQAVALDS